MPRGPSACYAVRTWVFCASTLETIGRPGRAASRGREAGAGAQLWRAASVQRGASIGTCVISEPFAGRWIRPTLQCKCCMYKG